MIFGPILALTIGTLVRLKYFGVFSTTAAGSPASFSFNLLFINNEHTDGLCNCIHLLIFALPAFFSAFLPKKYNPTHIPMRTTRTTRKIIIPVLKIKPS